MPPKFTTSSSYDRQINNILADMTTMETSSEEYGTLLERLQKLHKLKTEERSSRVSPDTVLLATTNLIGIFMIIRHEDLNVITSKALSFVQRPR